MTHRRRGKENPDFVGIERRVINNSKEWDNLSAAAKILYIHLKGRFNGRNNGDIELPYLSMKGVKGCKSSRTFSNAADELEKKKWIKRSTVGGLYRYKKKYTLTFKYDSFAKQ